LPYTRRSLRVAPYIALIIIASLTVLVGYFLFNGWKVMRVKTLLVAPYFIWLLIATSLNAYIYLKN
jgi:tryptophan-rich sensory protein